MLGVLLVMPLGTFKQMSCAAAVVCLLAGLVLAPGGARGADEAEDPVFAERAVELGLVFRHFAGVTGQFYFPETTASGAAFLDYDGDGDLDAFLPQGALLGSGETVADTLSPVSGPPGDRLFRNDLALSDSDELTPRFVDVTSAAGLGGGGYGIGVATGDYDGDGWVDLYVAGYGRNVLWRNRGDGTFADVTAAAGADDPRWSTGATFFDADGDGDLDLFVVNYVAFDVAENPRCFTSGSRRDYCGPSDFPPVPDSLLENRGDGTFRDVSGAAGIAARPGPGLGVIAADLDGDGRTDLYVANDGAPNFLWLNQGGGRFVDEALLAGVAVNREGEPEAGMGVDAGDFDGDGDLDLFVAHLAGETNTLYVNQGDGLFEDRSIESALAAPSLPHTGFGAGWLDWDNDGWLDLLVVNGAVRVDESQARAGEAHPFRQPGLLFRNLATRPGEARFAEVTARAGGGLEVPQVSRGAAFGDVEGDGDTDVLVSVNEGPARLLVNRVGAQSAWLGLALYARAFAPAAGARVEVTRDGAPARVRHAHADGSYASASDSRVVVGLGESAGPVAVRIAWPGGRRQTWRGLAPRRYWVAMAPHDASAEGEAR